MRMKRITALALAGCLTASMLTACGNANSTSGAASGSASAATTETAEVPADAGLHNLSDGVLDIGTTIKWDSLTPLRSQVGNNAPWAYQVYETLAVLNYDKEYKPQVAKSWSAQDDGLTFDVEIYDYVTDSAGNNITANDIVWMINLSKEAGLKPCFSKVESATATGDYTLQIKMTQDMVGAFEAILTNTFVVSQAAYEASGDEFATQIVSSAPYVITEFTPGSTMTIEKRDDYWQDVNNLPECVRPVVEKISFHSIPEASQMGIALETGEIDMAMRVDSSTGAQFVGNDNYTVELTEGHQGWQLFFSGADTSVCAEDVNLRQAIAERQGSLEKYRMLIRLDPALGLLGTLIPMGTALASVGKGEINLVSAELVVAFTTTVVGLAVGSIAFLIYSVKRRWVASDIRQIEYITEVMTR